MKRLLKTTAFLAMILCFSCDGYEWVVDCADCIENEPYFAAIQIKIRDTDAPVTINIYEGNIEDNILYASYQAGGSDYTTQTGLNKIYTFTATYNIDGKTYVAVNSTIPRVKYQESECENPCYYIYNNVVDLRLKYTIRGN